MKRTQMFLVLSAMTMLAAACGDTETIEEGTARECADQNEDGQCDEAQAGPVATCVDQDANGVCDHRVQPAEGENEDGVNIDVSVATCSSNKDCFEDQLCVVDLGLTERFGHAIQVCDLSCDVETESNLGSVCVVAGSDTCQRDGNEDLFCLENGKCRELTEEELEDGDTRLYCDEQEEVAPADPGSTPAVNADQVILTVCYSNILSGYFVQMSWSTATLQDPSAWDAGRDRTAGSDGCGSTEPINRDSIAVGFWADVTRVRAEDAAPGDWLTTSATVSRAYLTNSDGTTIALDVRYFEYGKGRRLGTWGGDDHGCSDSVATCTAP